MSQQKRYVLVGSGSRGIYMFAKPILTEFQEHCQLVGLFDHNLPRLKAACELLGAELPLYTDFRKMLRETRPDAVIVTTRDGTHAQFIVQALEAGKRVISEKPLCVDARQCQKILDAAEKHKANGAECFVAHNMRYTNTIIRLKELIDSGVIGRIQTINFNETLDRHHGADYFRRWHRLKKNSGGLQIHKASHHFDTLNWLVGSRPSMLVAQGALAAYGKNGPYRNERCEGCPHSSQCEYYVDFWQNEERRKLYKEAESADGYIRDACVYDPSIDIEDQVGILYTYENGVHVTYNLTAFASYEGWHVQFQGTEGRLELREVQDTGWGGGGTVVHGMEKLVGQQFTLYSAKEGVKTLEIPPEEGTHGGADPALQRDFFGRPFDASLTDRQAPLEQAIQAVLIGHAANVSMAKGSKPVDVQGLLNR